MTNQPLHSLSRAVAVLLVLGLASTQRSFGLVGGPTDCKQTILAAYHKLAGLEPSSKGVYHLQFTSTTTSVAPGQQAPREATVHGELYSQDKRGFFQTDEVSMWQDGRYVATVLHSSRTVVLTRTLPGQAATDPRRLFMLRDSLIQLGKVQQCRSESGGKQQALQHIQLAYAGALATRLKIKTLDFWLAAPGNLQRMTIHYLPGGPTRQVTLRFPLQELLAASPKLPVDARTQVVTADGKLLPRFQGYRLVNQLAANQ